MIEAMKVEGPLHVVCQCDKCKAEKQEPVAFVSGYYSGLCVVLPIDTARLFNPGTALYEHPQPKHEENGVCLKCGLATHGAQPAKSKWVGLTDEDLRQIILAAVGVAEAKLKEKNT